MVRTRPGSSSIKRMREFILHLRWSGGNSDNEFGALHRLALYGNLAPVRFDDALDQVEAETSAVDLVLNRPASAEEWVKKVFLFVERDTGTVVYNADFDGRPGAGIHCS